jgi:MFS family permease
MDSVQKHDVRKILAFSTLLNGVFCILFGLAPWVSALLMARFGIGATLAFITIYAPVWVDEFAPREHQTQWISLLQISIPLGVMAGYGMLVSPTVCDD